MLILTIIGIVNVTIDRIVSTIKNSKNLKVNLNKEGDNPWESTTPSLKKYLPRVFLPLLKNRGMIYSKIVIDMTIGTSKIKKMKDKLIVLVASI